MKNEDVSNFYDDFVARQLTVGVNRRHFSILEKLIAAGLTTNDSILEIGCGIGTFTGLLIQQLKSGSLTAMDISGKSIEEAQKKYGGYKNLSLIHANALEFDFRSSKFDAVVLPDVIEHIPLEFHSKLFEKISQVLNPQGFVFIHIPNPNYLQWCNNTRPDTLQVIDQPIMTNILADNIYPHGLYISELKTYSIWVKDGDYQYIILKKVGWERFLNTIEEKISFWSRIKHKLNV